MMNIVIYMGRFNNEGGVAGTELNSWLLTNRQPQIWLDSNT